VDCAGGSEDAGRGNDSAVGDLSTGTDEPDCMGVAGDNRVLLAECQ
jgi:hypothetical protein